MTYKCIQMSVLFEGQVGEILLASPPSNIVSAEMMVEISSAIDELSANAVIRMITIGGVGDHFSFGASVEEHQADQVKEMLPGFHAMIRKILHCPVPTLAKLNGFCLGGGFEVAMACTFMIASKTSKVAVPEIQLGVFPPVACALLPCKVPDVLASQIILSGEKWRAHALQAFGLVNEICDADQLDYTVEQFFRRNIQTKSASSLRIAHRATRMHICAHYDRWIAELEALYLNELMQTKDANEGIEAFMGKRKPTWADC